MNETVARFQLKDTRFVNPDGLDAVGQYTSAFDITILARYLLRNPLLATIVGTQNYLPLWNGPKLWSTNPLLYAYDGAIGVKTGRTDLAKESLVGAAEQGGRRLVASVLRSDDMYADVSSLLDWGYSSVPIVCPPEAITPAG
jgi:D-alanyl-D-alanine carboxypeptidase